MTTTQRTRMITAAAATRRGTRDHNADSYAIHTYEVAELTGAAVVDGIGSTLAVADASRLAAEVAVRVGVRRGGLAGLLAAAELYGDPGALVVEPDGVAVLALAEPGEPTLVYWIGDARAHGFDGKKLRLYSTDHSMGEFLRHNGGKHLPLEQARLHDNWVRATLGRAVVASVCQTAIPDKLTLLTSDGVHDHLDIDELDGLVHAYPDDPQGLATALVDTVEAGADGYRDDATAVVLHHHG
ncbi:PP2C family protein-serine/threonine phosphatase [Streptomyces sp. NPDC055036]